MSRYFKKIENIYIDKILNILGLKTQPKREDADREEICPRQII